MSTCTVMLIGTTGLSRYYLWTADTQDSLKAPQVSAVALLNCDNSIPIILQPLAIVTIFVLIWTRSAEICFHCLYFSMLEKGGIGKFKKEVKWCWQSPYPDYALQRMYFCHEGKPSVLQCSQVHVKLLVFCLGVGPVIINQSFQSTVLPVDI